MLVALLDHTGGKVRVGGAAKLESVKKPPIENKATTGRPTTPSGSATVDLGRTGPRKASNTKASFSTKSTGKGSTKSTKRRSNGS